MSELEDYERVIQMLAELRAHRLKILRIPPSLHLEAACARLEGFKNRDLGYYFVRRAVLIEAGVLDPGREHDSWVLELREKEGLKM